MLSEFDHGLAVFRDDDGFAGSRNLIHQCKALCLEYGCLDGSHFVVPRQVRFGSDHNCAYALETDQSLSEATRALDRGQMMDSLAAFGATAMRQGPVCTPLDLRNRARLKARMVL